MTPGIDEISIPPVSVCHHVSTIGHLDLPMFSLYQFQASSLIGSPTVPKILKDERSLPLTKSTPCLARALIAVGQCKTVKPYIYLQFSKTYCNLDN